MAAQKVHHGPDHGQKKAEQGKRGWTVFELMLLSPFALLLLYIATEPLVLPAQHTPLPQVAVVTAPQPASGQETVAETTAPAQVPQVSSDVQAATPAMTDGTGPTFVTAGTTILQRIAPVAMVVVELPEQPVTAAVVPVDASRPEPEPVPAPAAAIPPAAAVQAGAAPAAYRVPEGVSEGVRFEVSDSTSVDGLAKSVAQSLEQSGVPIARIASVPAGAQRRTVILYRDGFEDEARRLGLLFSQPPAMVRNARPRNDSDGADVRLMLGTAASRDKALLAPTGATPKQ